MSAFWETIGMKEIELKEGRAEVQLTITPQLLQRRGSVHGGVLATLVDAAIGAAVRSTWGPHESSVTAEVKIHFLRPAVGSTLTAKSFLSHRGKTMAVGTAEVFDDRDRLVAMGTGTFIILKEKKD